MTDIAEPYPRANFADLWDAQARRTPDAPCQIHGARRQSWDATAAHADSLATVLLHAGAAKQGKVAQYLYNCPEYLESVWACFKAGLVPVNTNYRYKDAELVYLWTNADVVAVVFHGRFADTIERIRADVPLVATWLWVDDHSGPCPPWAVRYDDSKATAAPVGVHAPWGRSADDLYLLYTGGTTGLPKGVMWRQADVLEYLTSTGLVLPPAEPPASQVGTVHLPAAPLMHGTGFVTSLRAMTVGGAVVTLQSTGFDVVELLDTVQEQRVTAMAIVGDAFGKPILRALDEEPGRWDISSLRSMTSSGVMWSAATKDGLLRHNPTMALSDSLGSAEAMGVASSVATGAGGAAVGASPTGQFKVSANTRVIAADGRFIAPGTGEVGLVGVRGFMPVGYYKDPEKTARAFRVIDGERYSIPGDYVTVNADGSLTFLGRGSTCINTGGEKVFPEEVEEAMKTHPSVRDAVVVGLPDERFGESVNAVVEPAPEATVDADEIAAHVRSVLAGYKVPKRIVFVSSLGRAANGKADYARWQKHLRETSTAAE